jgi:hypothetical protein
LNFDEMLCVWIGSTIEIGVVGSALHLVEVLVL